MDIKYFKIGVTSEITHTDENVIIRYEEEGLISPLIKNMERLYTSDDIEQIMIIKRLTDDLGVNLAGVDIILNMRAQIIDMQKDFEKMIEEMKLEFRKNLQAYESRFKRPLIESKKGKIVKVDIED